MAELNSKHVTWEGLQYYDSKIKQYVNEITDKLSASAVTSEELAEIVTKVNMIENSVIANTAKIEELFNENLENEENIKKLFESDKLNGERISSLLTTIEFLATKEEVASNTTNIESIFKLLNDLTDFVKRDHITLEDIRISLERKADKDYVDNAINEIEHPTIDLTGYATEEFVIKKIAEAELSDQDVDLSAYYTKSETEAAIKSAVDAVEVPDVSNLATKEELEAVQNVAGSNSVKLFAIESDLVDINQKLDSIENPDLSDYATKDAVAAVEAKVDAIVIPEVPTKVSELENDAKFITIADVPETDLSNYYNKTETENLIAEAVKDIEPPTVDLDGYATEEWVNNQGFLKEHQDLSEYAKKSEVPSIEGLATEDFVRSEIAKAELNGGEVTEEELNSLLANYYNKSEVNALIPDTSKFITEVPSEYITDEELEEKGYLTEHQSLEGYAKLTDIPDVSTFATKTEVANQLDAIKIPTKVSELTNDAEFITEDNLSDYAKRDELFSKDYNDLINTPVIPSVEGLATEQWVKDELAKIDPSIPSEYITETELLEKGYITDAALADYAKADSIPTKTSQLTNDSNFLTEHQDISGKADKSDLEGLATEQFVTDAISNIKHPDPDLSNYYTKGETDSAINEAIDGIEIPEIDLAPYATKAQVAEQVAAKANNVPFTTDMFVTKPQGGFVSGDNLKGLSVTAILTKLLGLQAASDPDEPDVPDEPTTIVDKIIKNQLGMYQVNEAGEIIEIPYNYVTYDNMSYDAAPDADYFYQKLDENGEVIESGYQHVSDENDSMYYLIALPQGVNFNENVSAKVWDTTSNTWADASELQMSSDLEFIEGALVEAEIPFPVVPEGYTLWIDATLNTCSGEDFRFIIN